MKLPQISSRIREISGNIEDDYPDEAKELCKLAEQMRRRSPGSRAAATSQSMSEELKQDIRDYKRSHPGLSQQKIAEKFNVNHGRVSEIVSGKRR